MAQYGPFSSHANRLFVPAIVGIVSAWYVPAASRHSIAAVPVSTAASTEQHSHIAGTGAGNGSPNGFTGFLARRDFLADAVT